MGNILVTNWTSAPVTLTVRVDRAGSTVFQEAVDVESEGETLVEQTWETEPAEYTILYAREGEGRIDSVSLPEQASEVEGECIDVTFNCHSETTDIMFEDDDPQWGQC